MNFKSIIVLGLSVATLGLSLPAHADEATVVGSDQQVVVTGDANSTNQTNRTTVTNRQTGRRSGANVGTTVNNVQGADIQGNFNDTNQNNKTTVRNSTHRR
jgi:hypothetical protein